MHLEASRINWNRVAALVATIAVMFLFTRSAPFPAGTFWELTLARDFAFSSGMWFSPEQLSFQIVRSTNSLLGLKAVYHILYFLICSSVCVLIFRMKEMLPGLIIMSVFALSMQNLFSLGHLFVLLFTIILVILFDETHLKDSAGLVLILISATATGLGLPSWVFVLFVLCQVLFGKKRKLLLLFCAAGGLLAFPDGLVASFDSQSVFNFNYFPANDAKMIYLLGGIFLIGNIFRFSKFKKEEVSNIVFYVFTIVLGCLSLKFAPIFLFTGLILLIKSFKTFEPMSLNYQLIGIIILTVIVHLFLFFHPLGLKLNPSVNRQIGKNLAPILDGYVMSQLVENTEIGELVWKGIIKVDFEDLKTFSDVKEWRFYRSRSGEFAIEPAFSASK